MKALGDAQVRILQEAGYLSGYVSYILQVPDSNFGRAWSIYTEDCRGFP
jgi:hypothetical protein